MEYFTSSLPYTLTRQGCNVLIPSKEKKAEGMDRYVKNLLYPWNLLLPRDHSIPNSGKETLTDWGNLV